MKARAAREVKRIEAEDLDENGEAADFLNVWIHPRLETYMLALNKN